MTDHLQVIRTIFMKEMWEHLRTRRMLIIGIIFAVIFIAISL